MRKYMQQASRLTALLLFLAATTLASLPTSIFAQESPVTWGDFINEPEISYGDLRSAQEHLNDERIVMSIFSGLECTDATYPILTGVDMPECWYDSAGHKTTKGGQGFVPAGETKAGFMQNFETLVFPTKTNAVIEQSAAYDRAWIRAGAALNASLLEDPEGNQPNYWIWDNPASLALVNKDGSPFYFHGNYLYAQATYSHNGRWLLLFDESGYLIRIDLEQLTISTYRITEGQDVFWPAIAISDSGRYIAVNDRVDQFFIMDTEGCTDLQTHIDIPAHVNTCTKRSLRDYALEYFDGLHQAWLEFYGDHIARVKGLSKDGQTGEEIIIRAPNTSTRRYVALGDSYSSGEGAGSYIEGTDVKNVNMCHTSTKSYSYWMASRLDDLDDFKSVACSGAKLENYWFWAQQPKTPSFRHEDFPGKNPQRNSIAEADIVTIGMSGNDIGFSDMLIYCLREAIHCYNSYEARMEIANLILEVRPHLTKVYKDLLGNPPNKRRVYVVGYPQIMSVGDGKYCGNNVHFTEYQRSMANDLITFFNAVIKSAAEEAGVFYVGVEGVFGEHKLCGSQSHISAMNGLTFGDEIGVKNIGPFSNGSYHPTATGQRMLGQRILEATNNLRIRMPRANKYVVIPDPHNYAFTQGLPSGNGVIHKIKYNVVTDNALVQRGVPNLIKTSFDVVTWAPRSFVKVILFSEPTDLGEFEINELGELNTKITIPDSVPVGMHELQINGLDQYGQPASIRQFVYVSEDENLLNQGQYTSTVTTPPGNVSAHLPFIKSNKDSGGERVYSAASHELLPRDRAPTPHPVSPKGVNKIGVVLIATSAFLAAFVVWLSINRLREIN